MLSGQKMLMSQAVLNTLALPDQGVAYDLLHSNETDLDLNVRKIRSLCAAELQTIAVTGCMHPLGRLRALLIQSALLVRLDTQELESFNSILKVTIARGGNNRLSLELLSSRACLRKLVAMGTGGATRVRELKPFAASLARSVYLYYDGRLDVLRDPERWRPCSPLQDLEPNDPSTYDPSATPTDRDSWALPFNSFFAKAVKKHNNQMLEPSLMMALVVPKPGEQGMNIFLVGAQSRCQVMLVQLTYDGSGEIGDKVILQKDAALQTSLSVIAGLHGHVHELAKTAKQSRATWSLAVPKVKIYSQVVKFVGANTDQTSDMPIEFEIVEGQKELCQLKAKFQRVARHRHSRKPLPEEGLEAHALSDDDLADDDGDNVGPEIEPSSSSGLLQDKEAFTRMLLGLDDFSDDDDDNDNVLQLLEAEDMNTKITVAAADQNMELDPRTLQRADELVDDRLNMFLDEASNASVSRTDLENEAFLQEVLLKSLTRATQHQQQELEQKPRNMTTIMHVCYFGKWLGAIRETISALQFRQDCASREIGENREVSLILDKDGDDNSGVTACFVQWSASSTAKINEGRVIKLDESNRIVCPVNFLHGSRLFHGHEVILPAAGVQVKRVRKPERPPVPKDSLRLYDIFNAALVAQSNSGLLKDKDMLLDDSTVLCAACAGNCDENCLRCAFCLLTTHSDCQSKLVPTIDKLKLKTMSHANPGASSSSSSSGVDSASHWTPEQYDEFASCMSKIKLSVNLLHVMFLAADITEDTEPLSSFNHGQSLVRLNTDCADLASETLVSSITGF